MAIDELVARASAVQQVAASAGWTYVGDGQPATGLAARMGYRISNMCAGVERGEPFTSFDVLQVFPTVLPSGERGPGEELGDQQTVGQMGFPAGFRLTVMPAATGTDLFVRTGHKVVLESADFDARFQVYCDDQVLARMVLNPAVMELLLQAPFDVSLILQKNLLQVSSPRSLVPADSLRPFVAVTASIRESAISAAGYSARS